jgi:hypothetical protein
MNTKSKIAIGIVTVVILAGIVFSIFHRLNFLRPQKPPVPGTYITKNQLANVGYNTPEAAFETMMWAMMNGNYDKMTESFSPEIQAEMKKATDSERKRFETKAKQDAPSFKGMQILAKKKIADDQVDLKISMDGIEGHRTISKSEYGIQLMVKIGNEWKATGGFDGCEAGWDNGSQLEPTVQQ